MELTRLEVSAKVTLPKGAFHLFSSEESINGSDIEIQHNFTEVGKLDSPQ